MRAFNANLLQRLFLLAAVCLSSLSASPQKILNDQKLASLEQRAAQAPPNDQCYLYAQLVHEMVEYSAREYVSGDPEKATQILKQTKQFAHKIRTILTRNSKKIKDTQILLRRTAFRLTELLHSSSHEDRLLVEETLAQVNEAQQGAMMHVFKR